MKFKKYSGILIVLVLMLSCIAAGCLSVSSQSSEETVEVQTITDGLSRKVTFPVDPERIVCQGPGALRYICYLGAQDAVVGVEDIELRKNENKRPYAITNPQFQDMPLIGEYRGNTDPEKIVAVDPDVIFWTFVQSADDADELQAKTGIPVVALNYGDLGASRNDMYFSLRTMAEIMGKEERAEEVIDFFDMTIEDLNSRTEDIPEEEKVSVYVGGIAYRGPHGFQSTEPSYPPFALINAKNVAASLGTEHADVSKEAIIEWDPEMIFVDLSTYQTTPSAVDELKTDPAYVSLTAVKNGEVYGVLPYNWYSTNHGSVIAAAYYSGKVIYPERFQDIEPSDKADEIYVFLFGEPAYKAINSGFSAGFGQIEMDE